MISMIINAIQALFLDSLVTRLAFAVIGVLNELFFDSGEFVFFAEMVNCVAKFFHKECAYPVAHGDRDVNSVGPVCLQDAEHIDDEVVNEVGVGLFAEIAQVDHERSKENDVNHDLRVFIELDSEGALVVGEHKVGHEKEVHHAKQKVVVVELVGIQVDVKVLLVLIAQDFVGRFVEGQGFKFAIRNG